MVFAIDKNTVVEVGHKLCNNVKRTTVKIKCVIKCDCSVIGYNLAVFRFIFIQLLI